MALVFSTQSPAYYQECCQHIAQIRLNTIQVVLMAHYEKLLIQIVNMGHICENDMIQIKDMFQIVATKSGFCYVLCNFRLYFTPYQLVSSLDSSVDENRLIFVKLNFNGCYKMLFKIEIIIGVECAQSRLFDQKVKILNGNQVDPLLLF